MAANKAELDLTKVPQGKILTLFSRNRDILTVEIVAKAKVSENSCAPMETVLKDCNFIQSEDPVPEINAPMDVFGTYVWCQGGLVAENKLTPLLARGKWPVFFQENSYGEGFVFSLPTRLACWRID